MGQPAAHQQAAVEVQRQVVAVVAFQQCHQNQNHRGVFHRVAVGADGAVQFAAAAIAQGDPVAQPQAHHVGGQGEDDQRGKRRVQGGG